MKRHALFILLVLPVTLFAQQLPQYTQYTFNELLINPAVSGIESYWDVKSGYRSQWTGLQGAPTTAYFTISVPLNKTFTLNDYSQIINNAENPLGEGAANSYSAPISHGAFSLSLVSDKTGAYTQTHGNVGYAYHLRLGDRLSLSTGASVGFNNISLNTSQLTFANPLDPAISQGGNGQYKPDVGFGLWLYGPSFFIGASALQLLPQSVSFSGSSSGASSFNAQYFLTTGIKLYPSTDVTLLPSVVINPSTTGPLNYDANLKVAFRDVFWMGGAYRNNDAITGSFGINIGAFLTVGYSYDYPISDINTVTKGTHEIMIGLFLNNNYNTTSPRHTW